MAARIRLRRERSSGAAAPRPLVVVDGLGAEVAVLVDYTEYVALLRLVVGALERGKLPVYWRDAVDDCLTLPDGDAGCLALAN